jgi:thioredoxin 1
MKLFHFTADWCNPCKKMKPIIEEYIKENPDIIYEQINVDKDIETAKYYGILSIPAFIAINDNADIIARHTGVATKEEINRLFK